MKEITRVITAQITAIGKGIGDDYKQLEKEAFAKALKSEMDADDVQILDIQDFIMDKE